jgi:hypothetical protein
MTATVVSLFQHPEALAACEARKAELEGRA